MGETRRPRRPAAPRGGEEERAAVAERRSRALEEPLDARRRSEAAYPLFEVRNPLHGTVYLVMLPEFPRRSAELCTCTDFARRGLGTCKHIEAAYAWAIAHPESPPLRPSRSSVVVGAPTWKEIDRRLTTTSKGPEALRIRRAGAALFEGGNRA